MNNYTPIFTLFGIVIGWILTQLGHWYKGRKEDNRLRKEVLYYLLEIRFTIPRLDLSNLTNIIAAKILAHLPPDYQTKTVQKEIADELTKSQIIQFIKSYFESPFKEAEMSFNQAVKKLATVDPFMAYQLSGRTSVIGYAGQITDYINHAATDGQETFDVEAFKQFLKTNVNLKMVLDTVKELDAFIYDLSRQISIFNWIRAKRLVKNMEFNTAFDAEADLFIQGMIGKLNLTSS